MIKPEVKAFVNGKFYTMKEEGDTCEAVVVRDGKFMMCGTNEEAKRIAKELDAPVVDLQGRAIVPGFIDIHQHVQAFAQNLQKVNLRDVTSLEELQERIRERAKITPKGKLIQGAAFDHEKFKVPVLPTKEDLDKAAPDNPVIIQRYCVHTNVANSMALEMAGIKKGFVPSRPGTVEFGEDGEPTGRLWEQAAADLVSTIQEGGVPYEEIKDMVAMALKESTKFGITGVNPIQGKLCDLYEETRVYQDLRDEGRLPVRIYIGYDEFPGIGMKTGLGDEMVKYGFYKIYTDGSLGARSARLKEPYSDDPQQVGVMNHTQEELNQLIKTAYDRDLQIGIHAIGDKAIDMALTGLEACYFENPKEDIRFRLIHTSLIDDGLLERMKKLPIMCDIQPTYVSTNVSWSDSRVGDRAKNLFAWRRLVDAGLILAGSSDAPVEPINPLLGVYAAVTRCGYDGYPEGGWHPENKLTRYEAVSLYTKNAAYASFEENIKGTIEEGKLADFAVLDADVFQVPELEIQNIQVVKTYLSGNETFSRE